MLLCIMQQGVKSYCWIMQQGVKSYHCNMQWRVKFGSRESNKKTLEGSLSSSGNNHVKNYIQRTSVSVLTRAIHGKVPTLGIYFWTLPCIIFSFTHIFWACIWPHTRFFLLTSFLYVNLVAEHQTSKLNSSANWKAKMKTFQGTNKGIKWVRFVKKRS